MAEAHLDHPGDIHWFKSYAAQPVVGPCPHFGCKHCGTGVIAWGPSYERYELVECGTARAPIEGQCNGRCRAWSNERSQIVTPWLMVEE